MLELKKETFELVKEAEEELQNIFKKIDEICDINSLKVLNAFNKNQLSETHFNSTTGYVNK